jgi:hypothetical protein
MSKEEAHPDHSPYSVIREIDDDIFKVKFVECTITDKNDIL